MTKNELRVAVIGTSAIATFVGLCASVAVAQPACNISTTNGSCNNLEGDACISTGLRWDNCLGGSGSCTLSVTAAPGYPDTNVGWCMAHCGPPCGAIVCECPDESCDGSDGTGGGGSNGSRDEAACGDDEDCSNTRTDPVHVGSGAFLTEVEVDVRFGGSAAPIEFARHYTSLEGVAGRLGVDLWDRAEYPIEQGLASHVRRAALWRECRQQPRSARNWSDGSERRPSAIGRAATARRGRARAPGSPACRAALRPRRRVHARSGRPHPARARPSCGAVDRRSSSRARRRARTPRASRCDLGARREASVRRPRS